MPSGFLKNSMYGMALPVLGKRCEWSTDEHAPLYRLLKQRHAVGACIQRFEKGKLTERFCVGYATLENEKREVTAETVFRTASVAKMVTALLVFRLQTQGKLNVQEDISDLWGERVRNPHAPDAPITLGMLLSHTSSMVDSPAYFASFRKATPLKSLLSDPSCFLDGVPGMHFRYSNLGAGIIGCLLEKRFGLSFEAMMQQDLFEPLGVQATFDATKLDAALVADSYRVLPAARAFDAKVRIETAQPLDAPNLEQHYLLASGNLFLTAEALAKLTVAAWNGAEGFINEVSLQQMHRPLLNWPQREVCVRHGMGLFKLEDERICPKPLWGHQGFAYGAVNGVFFDEQGNGFASLNSGVSEQRIGHLALINRDLIRLWMNE